jgi:hypothetical protein
LNGEKEMIKKISLVLFLIFVTGYSKQELVQNPYNKKISNEEKIKAITNYVIQKEFDKIKKPIYPNKPTKPYVKPAQSLVKDRFEKTVDFENRVAKAKKNRKKYLTSIENDYKQQILAYNKQVEKLTNDYNSKINTLKNNIDQITKNAINIAYDTVYGTPKLTSIDYDADSEVYFGKITTSKGNYTKKVAIKMPVSIARKFFDNPTSPKIIYNYDKDQVTLKDIKVDYANKSYTALLTDKDYKSNEIKVAINDKDLNLQQAKLISNDIKLENSMYDIKNISYGKSTVAKIDVDSMMQLQKQRLKNIEQSQESLTKLLNNSKQTKLNKKAYAIIFGIEDYMLESDVSYSTNSAMMFMQYANKLLGVPSDQIWAFVGNKTTSGFIKSQWEDFLNIIEDDAVVYFYYSGHGVPDDRGDAYILPSDTNAETIKTDKTFMLKNIYSNLSKSNAKKVVAFVDNCFSGKDEKGKLLFDGVAPVIKVKKTIIDKNKMTVFTAGNSSQFSNEYKDKQHRLFSYFLMKGLAENKIDTKELFDYIKKEVAKKSRLLGTSYTQIPQIYGKISGSVR